jgi:uncharacterized membrane protein YozB (DUF420 family)
MVGTPWRQILSAFGGVLVLVSTAWVLSDPDIPNWAKVFEVVLGLLLLIDAVFMWRGERRLHARATEWLNRHVSR